VSLPPPPILGWSGIPPVWRRWFQGLFSRIGGSTGRLVVIDDDGSDATALEELEARIMTAIPERPDVAALEARIVALEAEAATRAPARESTGIDQDYLVSARESAVINQDYTPQRSEAHSGWNDILADIGAGRGIGVNAPTWTSLRDGLYGYAFTAAQMNEIWLNLHITHDYMWGSKVWPHVHWTTAGTDTGVVRWGIEYTFARGYGVEAFPATTTIYVEQAASGTAYTHMIAEPAEADGVLLPNAEPDGIIMCRVFRDGAHANDTCTDDAFGLFADLHFQSDGYFTNERNRAFTKRRV
jgi:hypothetical protein